MGIYLNSIIAAKIVNTDTMTWWFLAMLLVRDRSEAWICSIPERYTRSKNQGVVRRFTECPKRMHYNHTIQTKNISFEAGSSFKRDIFCLYRVIIVHAFGTFRKSANHTLVFGTRVPFRNAANPCFGPVANQQHCKKSSRHCVCVHNLCSYYRIQVDSHLWYI